jgi:DNA ligase-1
MYAQTMLDIFNRLQGLGRNDKIKELQSWDTSLVRKILRSMYSPQITFGIKKVPWDFEQDGVKSFDTDTWHLLTQLACRELTGNKAKQAIRSELFRLDKPSRRLLKLILARDAQCGINVATINAALPKCIYEHKVMLAEQIDFKRLKSVATVLVQPKLDGVRATYMDGVLRTRKGHAIKSCGHIVSELNQGVALDGELIIPGASFDEISGAVRANKLGLGLRYVVFDAPGVPNWRADERYGYLKSVVQRYQFVSLIPSKQMLCIKEDIMDSYNVCRAQGYEGVIVKDASAPYLFKRSYDWMKIKPFETLDLKVVDLIEGNGKYRGMLGAAVVMYKGKRTKVSGFTDKERLDFWNAPYTLLNRTIEVGFHEVKASGALREPRFIAIRYDK